MPSFSPSAAQVKAEAKARAVNILSNHDMLGQILDRHEVTIRKRWLKKTMKQKKAILLTAWPNMAPSHRPDFEALKREEMAGRPGGVTMFREWFLWPTINLEDLSLKRSLLYFLHGRGRNLPGTFARSDISCTGTAHASRAVGVPFISRQTMFLDGGTPTKYGRLVSWDDDSDALGALRSGRAFSIDPGHALLTLEIQERLMQFLVECCMGILHDISDLGSLIDSYFPVQDILPAIITDAAEYPNTVSLTIERQYRGPSAFDYQQMRSIIGAKRGKADNHIWLLREDPSYFADSIWEWLNEAKGRTMMNLENSVPPSPPLRSHYVRLPQDPTNTIITIEERRSEYRDELRFLLQILWDPVMTGKFGLSDVLDQLEHLVIKEPEQKARLSTLVSISLPT
ncbi:hypothetical protein GLAREA_11538 [Glarea lozoyensis ATCC 20868]|uniref:Uncharacterized protein n=1 Tax=Glarea lozoyensis (strain ATCC 20868 / MF5171) TaxID=1116229 RepID=S3CEN4_GLAL2|nr:uncharacterized protein GLAREA_11538 [Glarea lozoyensis ATCC 20868]EPE24957.1 hypothetical protein GLAREA_11538 [Glarea lozoyensis ATCC 20868]